ncbi:hypothetical protein BDP27DRAFT_430043 [Rhodocollybia butyracea]|uniref:Uncharacterized protein n=1 Tax=Rhodocollybia butyracea TaxID=206335 RepID=A0A9P5PDP7_9AGAR|nr:hypothetical protein BDP27DRAFT_430043 [Rhodocollybia butyracea]
MCARSLSSTAGLVAITLHAHSSSTVGLGAITLHVHSSSIPGLGAINAWPRRPHICSGCMRGLGGITHCVCISTFIADCSQSSLSSTPSLGVITHHLCRVCTSRLVPSFALVNV